MRFEFLTFNKLVVSILSVLFIEYSYAQTTVNLNDFQTVSPFGATFEWHSSIPLSNNNKMTSSQLQLAATGTYYAVYNYSNDIPCYSLVTTVKVVTNVCSSEVINLKNSIDSTAKPTGSIVTIHSSAVPSESNRLINSTVIPTTTSKVYYVFYRNSTGVFINSNLVLIVIATVCQPVTVNSICPSNTFDLTSVAIPNNIPANEYTWHSSTPVSAANKITNITQVGAGTYYRAYYDVGKNTYNLTPYVRTVNIVNCCIKPIVSGNSRCGAGSTSLLASGCSGEVRWYNSASSAVINVGNTYTTPILSESVLYYVSCYVNGCESPRSTVLAEIKGFPSVQIFGANPSCLGNIVQTNGEIYATKFTDANQYSLNEGLTFQPAISSPIELIPSSGLLRNNLSIQTENSFTVRVFANNGCAKDLTVTLTNVCPSCPDNSCAYPFITKTK